MIASIDGLTDRAYMALRKGYGSDKAVFYAASVFMPRVDGGYILRSLCLRHGIDPDQE